ncbi:MAG: HPP family protein [Cyanobium sp. CACIAM 14]|nr:MAG: HPP family protein [Cyanobium sp. CACIAM 14]
MTLRADPKAADATPAVAGGSPDEPGRLTRLRHSLQAERQRGRAYQPSFSRHHLALSWLGALVSIGLLGALSAWSGHLLMAAPLGASSVLLFGYPRSPLAQPRNIVLGNLLGGLIAVLMVGCGWHGAWAVALAVGLTILVGQQCRCLHPPAGGIAFLGIFLKVQPGFLLFPVLSGSLLLVLLAWQFSRRVRSADAYPVHWL